MQRIQIPKEFVSSLSKEKQVDELNTEVKCRLAPSPIHGVGVFAMRFIPKGERCYCTPRVTPHFYTLSQQDLNKLFPEVRQLVLDRWPSIANGSIFQSPNDDAKLLCFINHSAMPNYDVARDIALRDISVGEEIVQDYRYMQNWDKVYSWLIAPKKENE